MATALRKCHNQCLLSGLSGKNPTEPTRQSLKSLPALWLVPGAQMPGAWSGRSLGTGSNADPPSPPRHSSDTLNTKCTPCKSLHTQARTHLVTSAATLPGAFPGLSDSLQTRGPHAMAWPALTICGACLSAGANIWAPARVPEGPRCGRERLSPGLSLRVSL